MYAGGKYAQQKCGGVRCQRQHENEGLLYQPHFAGNLECDAADRDGEPVLLSFFCDLPRIKRFDTALQLQNKCGTLICFDSQREALERYCSDRVKFQTIDFEKWERSFFE